MTLPPLPPRHAALLRHVLDSGAPVAPSALEQALQVSRPTINRDLRDLLAAGLLDKQGDGRSTRYLANAAAEAALGALTSGSPPPARSGGFQWSAAAHPLVEALLAPLGTRTPVGYDSGFVNSYIPNQSSLLPPKLATDLHNAGRSKLPSVFSEEAAANITLHAKQDGIDAAHKLQSITVQDGKAFVMGTTPGFRTAIDLAQAPPPLEQTSAKLLADPSHQQQVHEEQQRVAMGGR